jgi:hypothetical protein
VHRIQEFASGDGLGAVVPLPRNERLCAMRRGDGVGLWFEMNCTRTVESAERWAYGEQRKRKPEKW